MPARGKQPSRTGVTPVLRCLLALTSDGQPHTKEEILTALKKLPEVDELSSMHIVRQHMSRLRRLVRAWGQDVVCEMAKWRTTYRRVVVYRHDTHRHNGDNS